MKATELNNGAMIVSKELNQVYIKVDNVEVYGRLVSRWVKNSAAVRYAIDNTCPGLGDYWNISDDYYQKKVEEGKMMIISDLREAEGLGVELIDL